MYIFKFLEELHARTLLAPDEPAAAASAAAAGAAAATAATDDAKPKADATPKPAERKTEESVPYDRFKAVNDAKAEAERAAAEAKAELARLQRSGLPELDRIKAELADERAQRERLASEKTAAEERATNLEKSVWVRSAAQGVGFHDPADALARINLADVKTEAGAQRAVEQLADTAKHLVKPKDDASHGGVLREVLAGGERKTDGNGDKKLIAASELEQMSQDQHVALMERDPELYHRSLAAASAA